MLSLRRENKRYQNMADQWFEELPPSCPPVEARECDGTYYRTSLIILGGEVKTLMSVKQK